jgi:hypothetical protein
LIARQAAHQQSASAHPIGWSIRALARQLEVRLLVIDEIHSVLAGTYREQRILLNSIGFLANA